MRKRTIKKIGNSYFIHLLVADLKDFNLDDGDEVNIEDIFVSKKFLLL